MATATIIVSIFYEGWGLINKQACTFRHIFACIWRVKAAFISAGQVCKHLVYIQSDRY